jgi:hypothetical protein
MYYVEVVTDTDVLRFYWQSVAAVRELIAKYGQDACSCFKLQGEVN